MGRRAAPREPVEIFPAPARSPWLEGLRTAARTRRMPTPELYGSEVAPVAFAAAGCFRRALVLGLFFIVLVITLLFMAGGPLLEVLLNILLSQ